MQCVIKLMMQTYQYYDTRNNFPDSDFPDSRSGLIRHLSLINSKSTSETAIIKTCINLSNWL